MFGTPFSGHFSGSVGCFDGPELEGRAACLIPGAGIGCTPTKGLPQLHNALPLCVPVPLAASHTPFAFFRSKQGLYAMPHHQFRYLPSPVSANAAAQSNIPTPIGSHTPLTGILTVLQPPNSSSFVRSLGSGCSLEPGPRIAWEPMGTVNGWTQVLEGSSDIFSTSVEVPGVLVSANQSWPC